MASVTRQVVVFLVLTFVLSAIPVAMMLARGGMSVGGGSLVHAVMWCPALAAFITCALFRLDAATLGWNWRPARYEWMGYALPLVYATPVYVATWLAVDGAFAYDSFAKAQAKDWNWSGAPNLATWLLTIPLSATVGVIRSVSSALGEEVGWRGFLLPRLTTRFGFTLGCLASGATWAVWHYPAIIGAGYGAGTSPVYELTCFTLMVIAMSFVMGWLRLKSKSLWPCALLHASHNLFIQQIFDGMTATQGTAIYITSEFGIGMGISMTALAVWFWSKRMEVNSAPIAERVTGLQPAGPGGAFPV
jgi:uncharacterized protein